MEQQASDESEISREVERRTGSLYVITEPGRLPERNRKVNFR